MAETQVAEDKAAFFRAYTEYNRAVFDLIEHRYETNAGRSFDDIFTDFAKAREGFLREIPTQYTETQKEDRFASSAEDKPKVRVLKFFKRQHRAVQQIPWEIRNTFRKLIKKARDPRPTITYRIPLRNLTRYYYREAWTTQLLPTLEKIYYRTAVSTRQLWRFEDQVYTQLYTHLIENYGENEAWLVQLPAMSQEEYETTIAELRNDLDQLEEEITAEVASALTTIHEQYTQTYDRVGTVELPARRFSSRALLRKRSKLIIKYWLARRDGVIPYTPYTRTGGLTKKLIYCVLHCSTSILV